MNPTEGDVVLIKPTKDTSKPGFISKPLKPPGRIETHRGPIAHTSIIGQRVRHTVQTQKGVSFRLHEPTLSEYIRMTPRLVTPIYPHDANLIVSLLDLHVSPVAEFSTNEPALEILEAGTGHGSLTLHLARAVHAANSARPPSPSLATSRGQSNETEEIDTSAQEAEEKIAANYEKWKGSRQAIIHTLDISSKYSKHAEKVVRGFRQGIYSGNVDFHIGELHDFFADRNSREFSEAHESNLETAVAEVDPVTSDSNSLQATASTEGETSAADPIPATATDTNAIAPEALPTPPHTPEPSEQTKPVSFLSHCILDLPGAHQKLELVSKYLHVDGKLIIFVPSVTQIVDAVETVRNLRLPLSLNTVLELGSGISGGREWDVRLVKIRAKDKAKGVENVVDSEITECEGDLAEEDSVRIESEEKTMGMVCRPKVGTYVVGGGFLGVWSKIRERDE